LSVAPALSQSHPPHSVLRRLILRKYPRWTRQSFIYKNTDTNMHFAIVYLAAPHAVWHVPPRVSALLRAEPPRPPLRETHGAVVLARAPLELRDAVSRGHHRAGALAGRPPPRHVVLQRPLRRPLHRLHAATLRRGYARPTNTLFSVVAAGRGCVGAWRRYGQGSQ
jgi:hypothetical protein